MNGVPAKVLEPYWAILANRIKQADAKAEFLREYPLEHVKEQIMESKWQCWKDGETFFITCINVCPSGFKAFEILLACGENMDEWNERAWAVLKSFARFYECDEIRFQGRPGWSRYGKRHEPEMKTEYMYKVEL